MNISDRIQSLRKAKGITQEHLADAVGVSRQAVSKWEAEQSVPDLERVVAMAEYFDVTTDYILRGIEPAPKKGSGSRVSPRTMCIIATALDAAGLILGGGLWIEYQNWLCVAVMLIFQLAGVTVWLLTKGERPRWFWAVNVWLVSLLPCLLISSPLMPLLYRAAAKLPAGSAIYYLSAFAVRSVPVVLWLLVSALATWLLLRKRK